MKKANLLLLCLPLVAGCAPMATSARNLDVNGVWRGRLEANDRQLEADLKLVQTGNHLEGNVYFPSIKEGFHVYGTLDSGGLADNSNRPNVDFNGFFTQNRHQGKFVLPSINGTFTFERAVKP